MGLTVCVTLVGNLIITDSYINGGADLKAYDVCGTTALNIVVSFNEIVLFLNLTEKWSDIYIPHLKNEESHIISM